ncbi:MAG: XrtV sorting system accessory protein [Caulobacteraceae bacterium]
MKTIYDLVTIAIFAGLVVLFLQRSTAEVPQDRMVHYLPPVVGCAAANYVGNHGQGVLAWVIILAVLSYVLLILRPFSHKP